MTGKLLKLDKFNILVFAPKNVDDFEIFETMGTLDGKTFKERKLDKDEYPATIQTLWPRPVSGAASDDPSVPRNRFVLRRKGSKAPSDHINISENSSTIDSFLAKFLSQPQVSQREIKFVYFVRITSALFSISLEVGPTKNLTIYPRTNTLLN